MSGRRCSRDGIRDRWVLTVGAAVIPPSVKMLLLYLVATHRVTDRGALTFHRKTVAGELKMHEKRIQKLIGQARDAGLLARVGGGWNARTSEYVVTFPATVTANAS